MTQTEKSKDYSYGQWDSGQRMCLVWMSRVCCCCCYGCCYGGGSGGVEGNGGVGEGFVVVVERYDAVL